MCAGHCPGGGVLVCRGVRGHRAHLVDAGFEALGVPTHMGDLDAVEALAAAAVKRFGGVDIVVNNAAKALAQPIGSQTAAALTSFMAAFSGGFWNSTRTNRLMLLKALWIISRPLLGQPPT